MKRKIILSLLILFVFSASGGVIATLSIKNTATTLNHLIGLHQVENLRQHLVMSIQTAQSDLYTIYTRLGHTVDRITDNVNGLEEAAGRCSSCHHTPEMTRRIEEVQSLIRDYENALSGYITASADKRRIAALKFEAAAIGNKLLATTEDMSIQASEKLEFITSAAMRKINKAQAILYLSMLVTFILGIMAAVHLTRSITRPVNALVNAARAIASLDLGHTIPHKDKTEFGELTSTFNAMSMALRDGYKKLTEEIFERRQTQEALAKSEAFLNTIFDSIRDPFCILDKDYRVIRANEAYAAMKNRTAGDLIGKICYTALYGRDAVCEECIVKTTFLSGDSCVKEKHATASDGMNAWLAIYTYPIVDKEGAVSHVIEYTRDITERKRAEEELLRTQKLESISVLAGGIAHDFNNLLAAIMGNVSLAMLDISPGNEAHTRLVNAEKASLRAQDLTQQLLTFSKGGTPVKTVTSLGTLIKETAGFSLRGSKVKCELVLPGDLWPVEADEGQITQVINNLVINADQAMQDGGIVTIRGENIALGARDVPPLREGNYVKISVRDRGAGIPKEHLTKIFDPFFTTKQKGNGLGLAVSYSIIKKHEGHIAVESEPRTGTTFSLYLPASAGEKAEKRTVDNAPIRGRGKILVMDDEQSVGEMAKAMLQTLGYEVECVEDGTQAIERYQQAVKSGKPYDAIIMDLTIAGGMGGKEAIKKLLEIDPRVKAIVSSGYSNDPVMAGYKNYGFHGVISKPYRIKDLSEVVYTVVTSKGIVHR